MPKCVIHLSLYAPKEKRKREEEGDIDVFVKENPRGVYQGLEANGTYYVYVEQEAQQLARDQERMRRVAAHMDGAPVAKDPLAKKDDGRAFESCSCIEGNPCVDEYGCRDWSSRFAIAKKNGYVRIGLVLLAIVSFSLPHVKYGMGTCDELHTYQTFLLFA
jgi:hypothetical protein